MTGYTKLFQSLVTSSIWDEDDKTRIVWITMLALSNRDGLVEASVSGLGVMSRVSREDCQRAIDRLSSPDPDSRSVDFEGRRVERVDGGFKILNHNKYRSKMSLEDRKEYCRLKQQEYRSRKKEINRELVAREIVDEQIKASL